MVLMAEPMRVFNEYHLREHLLHKEKELRAEVSRESADRLLNVNETEYIDYLVSRYIIAPPEFDLQRVEVSHREQDARIPDGFGGSHTITQLVVTYHVPFTGDPEMLRAAPSS